MVVIFTATHKAHDLKAEGSFIAVAVKVSASELGTATNCVAGGTEL